MAGAADARLGVIGGAAPWSFAFLAGTATLVWNWRPICVGGISPPYSFGHTRP
jgi:hypothetical protein